MRQRTTLFHHNDDAIDPLALKVSGRSLSGPNIKAVREDRFTFGLEELPQELRQLLEITPELHLRWSPSTPYDTMTSGPWTSRLPAGLHVFYTPQEAEGSSDPICVFLHNLVPTEDCSESLVSCPRYKSADHSGSLSSATLFQAPQRSVLPLHRLPSLSFTR